VFAKPSIEPDRKTDLVEPLLQAIDERMKLSVEEIVKGKGKKDVALSVFILNMFEKDPETFYFRLNIVKGLIGLASFLKIDLKDMRQMIPLLLTQKLPEK